MNDAADRARAAVSAAAKKRDAAALNEAARGVVAAARVPSYKVYSSPFSATEIGAALLTGQGPRWATTLRRRLHVPVGAEMHNTAIGSVVEAEMTAHTVHSYADVMLLAGDWRELPVGTNKPSAWLRPVLKRLRNLFSAFAKRDSKAAAAAIAAAGRADPAKWSLLAYALYKAALKRGMDVKVPRKYDF